MNQKLRNALLLLAVVPAGLAGVWKLQHGIDSQQARLSKEEDEVILRSPKLVKAMSLEYAPLLADIYWTRVVQYYGNKQVQHDTNMESLWLLLDLTTTLDPNLLPAYRFGSTFLSENAPRGSGRPDLAVELLKRGIQANPDQWRLYQDLGNVYYFGLNDYKKASEAFLEGSKNPNALPWMKVMAARIAERGETIETSRFLWSEIYNTSSDPQMKENARVHLLLLKADDDLRRLNELCAQYAQKTGREAKNIGELVQAGLIGGIPVDPKGTPYVIGEDGKAAISKDSPLAWDIVTHRRELKPGER